MVRSSIEPLIGGWRMPGSILSPLDFFPAAVMGRFIPIFKKVGEIEQHMIIPFSRSCHWVVKWVVWNCSVNPPGWLVLIPLMWWGTW